MRTFYKAWKNETSNYSTVTSNLKNNKDLTVSSLTTGIENTQINSFLSISFSHHYEIILKKIETLGKI